jgi:hypothetical protein
MKKYLFISLLLSSILLLCSCKEGAGKMSIFDDSDIKADTRMEQIIETLKNKDKAALKEMFSKQALSEADDFDGNLDALFNYVQGDIQSWESTGGYGGSDEKNVDGTGKRKKDAQSTYVFTTTEQEYNIAIYEYTIDTANPDNVGVYSICIISTEDNQEPDFVFWGSGDAGINVK